MLLYGEKRRILSVYKRFPEKFARPTLDEISQIFCRRPSLGSMFRQLTGYFGYHRILQIKCLIVEMICAEGVIQSRNLTQVA
jgi:hypothetical protein